MRAFHLRKATQQLLLRKGHINYISKKRFLLVQQFQTQLCGSHLDCKTDIFSLLIFSNNNYYFFKGFPSVELMTAATEKYISFADWLLWHLANLFVWSNWYWNLSQDIGNHGRATAWMLKCLKRIFKQGLLIILWREHKSIQFEKNLSHVLCRNGSSCI